MGLESKHQTTPGRRGRRMALLFLILAALVTLGGCDGVNLPFLDGSASEVATPTEAVLETNPESDQDGVQATPVASGPPMVTIWLPPQFDPGAGSRAGELLIEQIHAYRLEQPDLEYEIRIKAIDGRAGMMESLAAARAAAPDAMPSMIALQRMDLEIAALKGLIYPLEGLTQVQDDVDWYGYARQMTLFQEIPYGIPFAGDAMVLVYRPEMVSEIPESWPQILQIKEPLVFSARDKRAMMTLLLYQSLGGEVQNSLGYPVLQPEILEEVLTLYSEGVSEGVFPAWLTQVETREQAWSSYEINDSAYIAAWASEYLSEMPADSTATRMITFNEEAMTYADSWLWAITELDTETRQITAGLVEHLVQADFLTDWSLAAGYLPPRTTALSSWSNQSLQSLLHEVSLSAQVFPSSDIMFMLSSVLEEATMAVVGQRASPAEAAQAAVERLNVAAQGSN
jgi:multiple sugar transport system substrate-binding protein